MPCKLPKGRNQDQMRSNRVINSNKIAPFRLRPQPHGLQDPGFSKKTEALSAVYGFLLNAYWTPPRQCRPAPINSLSLCLVSLAQFQLATFRYLLQRLLASQCQSPVLVRSGCCNKTPQTGRLRKCKEFPSHSSRISAAQASGLLRTHLLSSPAASGEGGSQGSPL